MKSRITWRNLSGSWVTPPFQVEGLPLNRRLPKIELEATYHSCPSDANYKLDSFAYSFNFACSLILGRGSNYCYGNR